MFVERDTGAARLLPGAADPGRRHLPRPRTRICRAWPGRCAGRSCRPPPARSLVDGVERTAHGDFFQLRLIQARDRRLVGRPVPGPLVGRRGLAERPGTRPGRPGGHPRRRQPQRRPLRRGRHRLTTYPTRRELAMAGRKISPNLALDQLVEQRIAAGESIVHLGFGESRLPVFAPLARALAEGADRNAYGPVVGDPAARDAVAGLLLPPPAAHRGRPGDHRAGQQAAADGAATGRRRGHPGGRAELGDLRPAGPAGRQDRAGGADPGVLRRGARAGGAARDDPRRPGARPRPAHPGAHLAGQPDRHARPRRAGPRAVRDRRGGGPADRLGRDLPGHPAHAGRPTCSPRPRSRPGGPW